MIQPGEQLGYRYEVIKVIDSGSFGVVIKCIDHKDPQKKFVAAKISKNKKFDVDNAHVECKLLNKLMQANTLEDREGFDRIVKIHENFRFRQHIIIIFEHLNMNLYKFMRCNKNQKTIFQEEQLRQVCYQMV